MKQKTGNMQMKTLRKVIAVFTAALLIVGMMPQIGARVYANQPGASTVYTDGVVQAADLQAGDILYTCKINACEGYTFTLAAGGWISYQDAERLWMGYGSSASPSTSPVNARLTAANNYYGTDKDNYTFPIMSISGYGDYPYINTEGDMAFPYYDGKIGECWKVDSVNTSTKTVTLSGYIEPQNEVLISSEVEYATFTAPLECIFAKKEANTCIQVDRQSVTWGEDKWYVVTENVTISKRIAVNGTANLILADGATLTASKGITLSSGNTLNIYAQEAGTGALIATGPSSYAGIGGADTSDTVKTSGTLNVYGGQITAAASSGWAAGIGGGFSKDGGTVTIYRGKVTATGGSSGAGIGAGGDSGAKRGKGGTVKIYGGEVSTTGNDGGMGIGAGNGNPENGTLILGAGVALYGNDSAMPEGSGNTDKIETTANENVTTRNKYMKAVGPQSVPVHAHDWSYTVNGATITALCKGARNCDYKTEGFTLELKAPTSLTYDGETKSASITGYPTTQITGLAAEPTTVTYYNTAEAGSTTPDGEALEGAPEAVGNYVAQMTWGGKTASVPFSIIRNTISKTVTFKVVNGAWNDGTTADKTVTLNGYEGDALKLTAEQIPAVGSKPNDTYKEGSWDVIPTADSEISADTKYTYTYAAKEAQTKPDQPQQTQTTPEQPKQTQTTPEQPTQTEEKKAEVSMNAGFKVTQKGSKIKIEWGKVEGADNYEVYVAYCGSKFTKKATKNTEKDSVTITKLKGKKLNLKKNFKVCVVATKDGKKLAKTIIGHVVGRKNAKYTNAKSINLITKSITVEKDKTAKIKAKTILVDKKKDQLGDAHAKEFRYASSDKSIATVSSKGVVTGKSTGTCTVYVYSRNGLAKEVAVTVK